MFLADAHVHIHDCFVPADFLDAALANFVRRLRGINPTDCPCLLLLTESAWDHWFQRLAGYADAGMMLGRWKFTRTSEPESLYANSEKGHLIIVAGRQIVTAERLEVMALATCAEFSDNMPIRKAITAVNAAGGLPVLPWGFGKWSGQRGKMMSELLKDFKGREIFVGDNGGRPAFLPVPEQFGQAAAHGIQLLPGSDPLPFPDQAGCPGKFGFLCHANLSKQKPAADLKYFLSDPSVKIEIWEEPEKPWAFLKNQIRMQIRKRFR